MRRFPDRDPGTPDHRSPARYLLWLAGSLRGSIALGATYAIIWMIAQALIPYALGRAIDTGMTARDRTALITWGAVLLGLGVVQAATGILRHRCAVTNWIGAAYRTVQVVTRQAARLGATLSKRLATGEVVAVGVADVSSLGRVMDVTLRGSASVVAIVVVAALMLATSVRLALIVLIGVPIIAVALGLLVRPLHHRQVRLREAQGELTTRAVDIVAGLRVLRGIGGEEIFGRRYNAESQRVRGKGVRVARVQALLEALEILLPGALVAVIVWLGARSVVAGQITVGQLVTFYGYAVFLITPLRTITEVLDKLIKGYVAARRVVRVLGLEPEISDVWGARPPAAGELMDPGSGLVVSECRLTAVACASPDDAVALADRLGRYTDSAVTLGGVPLRELPLDDVRRRVLVTGNEARLFSGDLRTELDPSGHGTGLEDAVEIASAADIFDALPRGLDDVIAGAGREFSGGQQQRLRLIRALMADPETLVLIEPTSAVDAHTEKRVAERLRAGRAGRTTVIFATSPLVLDHADRVAYVEGGRVVAQGTHRELLADPRYASVVSREDESREENVA